MAAPLPTCSRVQNLLSLNSCHNQSQVSQAEPPSPVVIKPLVYWEQSTRGDKDMGGSVVHPPALSLHPGGVSTAVAGMQLAQPSPCLSFPIQRAGRALGCREQGLELLQGRAGCPQGPLQGYVSLDRSLTGLRWLLADLLCGPCSGLPGSGVWGSLGCCWWLWGGCSGSLSLLWVRI